MKPFLRREIFLQLLCPWCVGWRHVSAIKATSQLDYGYTCMSAHYLHRKRVKGYADRMVHPLSIAPVVWIARIIFPLQLMVAFWSTFGVARGKRSFFLFATRCILLDVLYSIHIDSWLEKQLNLRSLINNSKSLPRPYRLYVLYWRQQKGRVSGEESGTTDAGSFFSLQGTSANLHY